MDSREKTLMYLPFILQYPQYRTPGQFGFTLVGDVGDGTLLETGMDVGSAVVFSVNPPSPLESDVCADEESILRNWHTGGTLVEQSSSADNNTEAYVKFEPEMMDRGLHSGSLATTATTTALSNTTDRAGTSGQKSSSSGGGPGASGSSHNNKEKKGSGGQRRSGAGELHRKSELYKTELCITVSSGMPCK